MSKLVPPKPRMVGPKRTFAIVASAYNADYVQGLVDHAAKELESISPSCHILLEQVPGAYEIPVAVQELASRDEVLAVIALGVIFRGETTHAEMIASTVCDALMRIALEHSIPVVNEVLLLEDEEQARERCLGDRINRGTEAARTALEISDVLSDLRARRRN